MVMRLSAASFFTIQLLTSPLWSMEQGDGQEDGAESQIQQGMGQNATKARMLKNLREISNLSEREQFFNCKTRKDALRDGEEKSQASSKTSSKKYLARKNTIAFDPNAVEKKSKKRKAPGSPRPQSENFRVEIPGLIRQLPTKACLPSENSEINVLQDCADQFSLGVVGWREFCLMAGYGEKPNNVKDWETWMQQCKKSIKEAKEQATEEIEECSEEESEEAFSARNAIIREL